MTRLVSAPGVYWRSRRAWRRFLRAVMRADPDIIVGTEAKRRHLRTLVPRTRWVVRQRWIVNPEVPAMDREARSGGFAIWRRSITESNREPRQTQILGSRYNLLTRSPVLNRYIGYADLEVGGRVRRVFWVHVPLEASGRQDEFIARLQRAVKDAEAEGLQWLVGGDFNMPPERLAELLGGRAHGVRDGITGWVVSRGIAVAHERTLPVVKGFDHRPHLIAVQN